MAAIRMAVRSAWPVLFGLIIAATLPAMSASSLSGASMPLVLAVALVAAVALAIALAGGELTGLVAARYCAERATQKRHPARQCDPDAAGHVRSRAPGRRVAVAPR